MVNDNVYLEAGTLRGMLNKSGIIELRELGLQVGVASSTTYVKEDLINRLVEKICAQKRPMNGKYYEATDYDCNELLQAFMGEIEVKPKTVEGILDSFSYGAMLRSEDLESGKNEVFVPMWIMEKFDLRPGDYIEGQAVNLSSNSVMGLMSVKKVNGNAPLYARKSFKELKASPPKKKLTLSLSEPLNAIDLYSPIAEGMRCLIRTDVRGNKINAYLAEIPEKLKEQGIKVYSLFLGEAPEIKNNLASKITDNLYYTAFEESVSENLRIANVIWDKAKREVEMGERVAILVSRVESLDNYIERDKLRSMFGSAKYCNKGGSLTIIMCERRDFSLDDIADNVTIVTTRNGEILYDYGNSYSSLKNKE